jgi:hypothetical protein
MSRDIAGSPEVFFERIRAILAEVRHVLEPLGAKDGA